uniref:Uncharacterized protein n=1 Tax=Setaria italica TaxID=4555 RepID=K3XU62_SETIT
MRDAIPDALRASLDPRKQSRRSGPPGGAIRGRRQALARAPRLWQGLER